MNRLIQLLLLCFVTVVFGFSASPGWANVQELMTTEEFEAAGLGKLSKSELDALSQWVARRVGATASKAPTTAVAMPEPEEHQTLPAVAEPRTGLLAADEQPAVQQFGQEQLDQPIPADTPTQIKSKLVGEFRGWDGKTVFRLDNGQVWRQRVGGKYRSPRRTNPEVIVEKGRFGYYLKIVESGRTVAVKRVR